MKTRLILAAAATVFATSFAVSAPTFASLLSGADNSEVESTTITTNSARYVPVSAQPEPPQVIEDATVAAVPAVSL